MSVIEVHSDASSLDAVPYTSLSDLSSLISPDTVSKQNGLSKTESFNTVSSDGAVGTVAFLTLESLKVELQNRLGQIEGTLQDLIVRNIEIKKSARVYRVAGGVTALAGTIGSIFGAKKFSEAEDGNILEGAIVFVVGMALSIGIGSLCWCCNKTVMERDWVQDQITFLGKEKAILTQCKTDATFLSSIYSMYKEAEKSEKVELERGESGISPFMNFLQKKQGIIYEYIMPSARK